MDGMEQLEHEIRRHMAMASVCSGVVRHGHMEAAKQLAALRDQIGGEEPRQKLRSASNTGSPLRRFLERKTASLREKKSRGS